MFFSFRSLKMGKINTAYICIWQYFQHIHLAYCIWTYVGIKHIWNTCYNIIIICSENDDVIIIENRIIIIILRILLVFGTGIKYSMYGAFLIINKYFQCKRVTFTPRWNYSSFHFSSWVVEKFTFLVSVPYLYDVFTS